MKSIRVPIPSKGWNTTQPKRKMDDTFSPMLSNTMHESDEELRRRPGQLSIGNAATDGSTITHIMEHKNITGVSTIIVQTLLDNFYTWAAGTFTAIASLGFTERVRDASMGNLLVCGDGVNTAKKFNGTTWSSITTGPASPFSSYIGNIFHVHKGRMYAAGDPARRMDVLHSATMGGGGAGADYWSTVLSGVNQGGFIDCTADLHEGDTITGITTHLGRLVIMFENHIIFYDIEEGTAGLEAEVFKIVGGEGCISHDSIQAVGQDVLFLSSNGFKSLSQVLVQGDSGVDSSSIAINGYVKELVRTTVVADDIRAMYIPKFGAYVTYLTSTEMPVYQNQFKAWTKWTGIKQAMMVASDGTVYTCGTHVHIMDETTLGDTLNAAGITAIPMQWDTSGIRAEGDAEEKARWLIGEIIGTCDPDESITFEYTLSFDEVNKITETVILNEGGGGRADIDLRIPMYGKSEFLTMRIINNNVSDFRIHALESYYNVGGNR